MAKTKTKTKSQAPVRTKRSNANYKHHHYYLAAILAAVILLEFVAFQFTTTEDWSRALAVLDMTGEVEYTMESLQLAFTPMAETFVAVDEFVIAASDETVAMLDLSDAEPLRVVNDIHRFLTVASVEMEKVLDLSGTSAFQGTVAGIWIEQ